jgi:hypothetical protein
MITSSIKVEEDIRWVLTQKGDQLGIFSRRFENEMRNEVASQSFTSTLARIFGAGKGLEVNVPIYIYIIPRQLLIFTH